MSKSVATFVALFSCYQTAALLTECRVEGSWRVNHHKLPHQLSRNSVRVSEGLSGNESLNTIRRIFCLSDLHTDSAINMRWLEEKCTTRSTDNDLPGKGDLLVVAGDIAHELACVKKTVEVLQRLECDIFFVPGNHEAWMTSSCRDLGIKNSIRKLEVVCEACRSMGVYTDPQLVGGAFDCPVCLVPLQGWYDGTLSLDNCEDLCGGFSAWPWTDFSRCTWPKEFPPRVLEDENARIPLDLAEYFLRRNEPDVNAVRRQLERNQQDNSNATLGVMTVSHFLPNQQCLPDWKDVTAPEFLRNEWLDHGAPQISAKFAKVAGSALLDKQLRSLSPKSVSNSRHLHVFGHSHRPKDFDFEGVRYIHNPLGKPKERAMHMVNPDVSFQLLWDTSTGEIAGERVIRYWEEKGGGKEGLLQRRTKNRSPTQKLFVSATQSPEGKLSSNTSPNKKD